MDTDQKTQSTPQAQPEPAAKKPAAEKPATGNATAAKPAAAKPTLTPLQEILLRARRGEREVLPQLRKILDEDPSIWRQLGDLGRSTQQAWLQRITESDLRLRECIYRRAEEMKAELAGSEPTPLEKLLVERIVTLWLQIQAADIDAAASGGDGFRMSRLRLQRQESGQRRFDHAVKTLAQVRQLAKWLKIEVKHTGTVPPTPADAAPATASQGGRVSRIFTPDAEPAAAGAPHEP